MLGTFSSFSLVFHRPSLFLSLPSSFSFLIYLLQKSNTFLFLAKYPSQYLFKYEKCQLQNREILLEIPNVFSFNSASNRARSASSFLYVFVNLKNILPVSSIQRKIEISYLTRVYSGRMRTARLLTVSRIIAWGWGGGSASGVGGRVSRPLLGLPTGVCGQTPQSCDL